MRLKRTLIAWAVAFALGASWWSLRGVSDSRGATDAAHALVFAGPDAIVVEAIDHVRLARRGEEVMEFSRQNGRWMQTAPFPIDLDDWSARQLASDAASLVGVREIAATSAEVSAIGFAPPVASLVMRGGGKTWTLEFGKRGVAGRAFVRRADGPIEVVEGGLYERAVEADPREWRSRTLFPEALGRAMRITWKLGDGAIELGRQGDRWLLTSPVKSRADGPRADELIAGISRARCDGFLADAPKDLATFGLAAPAATITVSFAGEHGDATRTLAIGGPLGVGTSDRYAGIVGEDGGIASVVRLSAGTQSILLPRLETLIEPTGSGARAADIKRIEVRPKKSDAFELVRDLDRWTAARILTGLAGPAIAIPSDGPERLLRQLCLDRAAKIGLGAFPADMEVAQVLFYGFDQKPLDLVRIAKDAKTGEWGFENGDGALRVHPATLPLVLVADEYGVPR